MNIMERAIAIALAAVLPLTLAACDGGSPKTSGEAEHGEADGHDHSSEAEAEATGSDRVAIPAAVFFTWFQRSVDVEGQRMENAATQVFTAPLYESLMKSEPQPGAASA